MHDLLVEGAANILQNGVDTGKVEHLGHCCPPATPTFPEVDCFPQSQSHLNPGQ